MAGSGGPWGGSGKSGGGGGDDRDASQRPNGGRRPPNRGPQGVPEIDQLMKKGQDQLRVLMGGRGGGNPSGGGSGGGGFELNRATIVIGLLGVLLIWLFMSFYRVQADQRSVELFLGKFSDVGAPGLNFAPWPIVTKEVLSVTSERTVAIGVNRGNRDEQGLMLTGDENVVDIDFQVVWNINDPAEYLFNLRDPEQTIRAVSESAMREIIARSDLAPVLNRDRGIIAEELRTLIQATLERYDSGMQVLRVNFDRADPPEQVIDAFREVQAAEQQRNRLQSEADRYANQVLAGARGEAAQLLEEAEGYRARVVNEATGEASRFTSVLTEYSAAPEVTRKRLYLETMEQVLGDVDKIIIDTSVGGSGGQGIVPYLPLNELRGTRNEESN